MEHLPAALGLWLVFYGMIAYSLFLLVASWALYEKADEPGWTMLIPIYNTYVLHRIADKPGWWLILYVVPVVNLVITIVVFLALAEKFGKGIGYAFGLIFLSFIFLPLLAFGDAEYEV
jgi:hypothetical protein